MRTLLEDTSGRQVCGVGTTHGASEAKFYALRRKCGGMERRKWSAYVSARSKALRASGLLRTMHPRSRRRRRCREGMAALGTEFAHVAEENHAMRRDRIDAYLRPAYSAKDRARRLLWNCAYLLLFRLTPRPMFGWRSIVLRAFGATMGHNCHVYPSARIWAPWNLVCDDAVAIAEDSVVYNPAQVTLGSHAIVSQQAYLCGASHDVRDSAFPLIAEEIHIHADAWVCARAVVQMGVTMGEGSVLALGSVATRDLEPWTIYGGVPAKAIGRRVQK